MKEWYYSDGSTRSGPVDFNALVSMLATGQIGPNTLVWRPGLNEWRRASDVPELQAAYRGQQDVFSRVGATVNELTGTDKVRASHVGGLFSQVFKTHTPEDSEEVFATGLRMTSAQRAQLNYDPPTPWVFSRILVFFGAAFAMLWYGWSQFQQPLVIPGVIFIGSFAFPVAAAVFFFECNAAKDVSLFVFARLFIWGGVLSILLALALFKLTEGLEASMGASVAGLVEEPAKLAAVVLLSQVIAYRWTTSGICLGAAVGAGFAAFESAGYSSVLLLASFGNTDAMLDNIIDRGLLAPFSHVVWTAIAAGGLWRVKGNRPFELGMMWDRRCIAPLIAVMILHAVWNSSYPSKLPGYLGYFALGAIAWTIAIGMLLGGLRQLRDAHPPSSTALARG